MDYFAKAYRPELYFHNREGFISKNNKLIFAIGIRLEIDIDQQWTHKHFNI